MAGAGRRRASVGNATSLLGRITVIRGLALVAEATTTTGRSYRYCPVFAMVSIERPASVPCLPDTSVRM